MDINDNYSEFSTEVSTRSEGTNKTLGERNTKNVKDCYTLNDNYPNPFNPITTINYQIPVSCHVTLKVFDVLGKEVATLVNSQKEPGSYSTVFDSKNFTSGIYVYKIVAGSFVTSKKMILTK